MACSSYPAGRSRAARPRWCSISSTESSAKPADDGRPHERVRLFVHDSLLEGIDQPAFELHAPEPTTQDELIVRRAANRPGYVVEVPNLDMWAILRISG